MVSQTPPGETLDTGAIRIDNIGATSIMITNFSVAFNGGSTTVAIWSPLTINPGQTGIFTQTASFNFDSSDFGIFGAFPPAALAPTVPGNNEIGGCSSTAAILATDPIDAAKCAANAPVVTILLVEVHMVTNRLTGTKLVREQVAEGPEFLSPLRYFCYAAA